MSGGSAASGGLAAPYAVVVGGSNIDITGFPSGRLVPRDSNPGTVRFSPGGVGRNIAENMARLGVPTRLISVVGDDEHGARILREAAAIGLDMRDTIILAGQATSTYLCVLDESNDMAVAINDMGSIEALRPEHIEARRPLLEGAGVCVLDTNLPKAVLDHILDRFDKPVFFLDPVSGIKALKVKDRIGRFHTIKPNRMEAEVLAGIPIHGEADLRSAAGILHGLGVRRVFVSLGPDGVFASGEGVSRLIPNPEAKVVNASGAGDAFMAGLAWAYLRGLSPAESARAALAASAIAMAGEATINPRMSESEIRRYLEK